MDDTNWERVVDAETDDNEERGDICMALREAGHDDMADVVGGVTIHEARRAYFETTGDLWVWKR